jgi:hypothetical protein
MPVAFSVNNAANMALAHALRLDFEPKVSKNKNPKLGKIRSGCLPPNGLGARSSRAYV